MTEQLSFVDTHCHIDSILEREGTDWSGLRTLMGPVSPEAIVHVACHPEKLRWAREFSALHSNVYCAYGIHPHEASLYNSAVELELRECLSDPRCLALGEIGLDYHYDYSPRPVQKEVFRTQLALAVELNLPVVLHTREADSDTLDILREFVHPAMRIHVHCYTGSVHFARQLLELPGLFYFGFTGVITFRNADNVRAAAQCIPSERLLLETDGPYLAPVPWRGKTAHSGMIPAIAAALAESRGEEPQALMRTCRENTRIFYGI